METQLEYYWDDQDASNAGWFARLSEYQDGRWIEINDTVGLGGLPDLDGFGRDQRDQVEEALRRAVPDGCIIRFVA